MNGVILAGGNGTRLFPLTKALNKHMLPVYNKPMIYYSLSTLILAGADSILIITNPDDQSIYEKLLGSGSDLGIKIFYRNQERPGGLPEGLSIARDFFGDEKIVMILGDNIFHGVGLGTHLSTFSESPGATIFGFHVSDPENYGVVELDSSMKIKSLVEKPTSPKSNIAITGLYFFDEQVGNLVASLSPSKRGELEIVDLLDIYLKNDALTLEMLPRGTAWFDTGSVDGLYEASTYVKVVERRTGLSIGDPFQVSESLKIWSD